MLWSSLSQSVALYALPRLSRRGSSVLSSVLIHSTTAVIACLALVSLMLCICVKDPSSLHTAPGRPAILPG